MDEDKIDKSENKELDKKKRNKNLIYEAMGIDEE